MRSAARALLGSLDGTQADSAESFESRLRTAWKNSGKGEKTAEENLEQGVCPGEPDLADLTSGTRRFTRTSPRPTDTDTDAKQLQCTHLR